MKASTTNLKLSINSNKTKTSLTVQFITKRKVKKSSKAPRFNGFQLKLKRMFILLINSMKNIKQKKKKMISKTI